MPSTFAPRLRPAPSAGAHLPRLRAQVQALTLARLVRRAVDDCPAPARVAVGDSMRRAAGHLVALVAEACHCRVRTERAALLERAWTSLRDVERALADAAGEGLLAAERRDEVARHCRWMAAVLDGVMWAPMR